MDALWAAIQDAAHLDWGQRPGIQEVAFGSDIRGLEARCKAYLAREGKDPESISVARDTREALTTIAGGEIKAHRLCCQAYMGIDDNTALSVYYRTPGGEKRIVVVPGVNYIYD